MSGAQRAIGIARVSPDDGDLPYQAARVLRWRVLRAPLGMPPGSEENPAERESLHWVATESGRVVGTAMLHRREDGSGKLMQMAVAETHHGLGVGRHLFEAVVAEARALGLTEIFLHARETAIDFYRKVGCAIDPEVAPFTEVGIPHVRMRRRLVVVR
jgi:GNAT superfamily N-acetyltransferase